MDNISLNKILPWHKPSVCGEKRPVCLQSRVRMNP